jgi:hypothetical protein
MQNGCSYALVSSRAYFLGLLTALRALGRSSPPRMCASVSFTLIWHAALPDSNLSRAERSLVECVAALGAVRVAWHHADEERSRTWFGAITGCAAAPNALCDGRRSSALKLEAFFLLPQTPRDNQAGDQAGAQDGALASVAASTLIYLDSDVLVLQSPAFIFEQLGGAPRTLPWRLHTSRHASCCSKRNPPFNAGFFAFTLPVPRDFQQRLQDVCRHAAQQRKMPPFGDRETVSPRPSRHCALVPDLHSLTPPLALRSCGCRSRQASSRMHLKWASSH